ncbi:MAG TPA: BON domain-containing protein [Candidatus Limnocylindria bacterium]|nr:BON domain-containing protein [Candidatus Limnocylindria bacterium]
MREPTDREEDQRAAEDAFLEQPLASDADRLPGAGESDVGRSIEDAEGEPWMPPTDPVMRQSERGEPEVLGGFGSTSMDDLSVAGQGDEALAEAIRRELREDAATTDLDIEVAVRDGVAYLRGRVSGPEDADSAEEVAGRVGGLAEVVDQLEVPGL